jgi:hypothetical protein
MGPWNDTEEPQVRVRLVRVLLLHQRQQLEQAPGVLSGALTERRPKRLGVLAAHRRLPIGHPERGITPYSLSPSVDPWGLDRCAADRAADADHAWPGFVGPPSPDGTAGLSGGELVGMTQDEPALSGEGVVGAGGHDGVALEGRAFAAGEFAGVAGVLPEVATFPGRVVGAGCCIAEPIAEGFIHGQDRARIADDLCEAGWQPSRRTVAGQTADHRVEPVGIDLWRLPSRSPH